MYKVLEENIMLRLEDKWVSTKAVLSSCSGGQRVDWIDDNGNIIKSLPYCHTKYKQKD